MKCIAGGESMDESKFGARISDFGHQTTDWNQAPGVRLKGRAGGESEDESRFGAPGARGPSCGLLTPDSWLLAPDF